MQRVIVDVERLKATICRILPGYIDRVLNAIDEHTVEMPDVVERGAVYEMMEIVGPYDVEAIPSWPAKEVPDGTD